MQGNDIRNITSTRSKTTLLNEHAIAVDQDRLGLSGHRVSPYSRDGLEIWIRGPLQNGDYAVALVNKNDAAMDLTLKPGAVLSTATSRMGTNSTAFFIFDIFAKASVGVVSIDGSWCFPLVEAHGSKFLRLSHSDGAGSSNHCAPHPPAKPGPAPGPAPPFSPPCAPPLPTGWIGPFAHTLSDRDCPNLGNHVGTLEQCERLCNHLHSCTAMNWGPNACALRGCVAGQLPTGPTHNSPTKINGYLYCNTSECPKPGQVPPPSPSPLPPPPAPPMPPVPLMNKVGAYIMQAAETSPILWKGRTLLMQTVSGNTPGVYDCCVCRTFGCVANASAPIGYSDCSACNTCAAQRQRQFGSCIPQFFQLVDYETLEILVSQTCFHAEFVPNIDGMQVSPIPHTEDFEMGSATTFGGKLWVFGTSGGHGTATKKARIHVFSSADPTNSSEKAWTNTEVLQLPDGLQPFNTDVHHVVGGDPAHPERQHIMVIETNGDAFPHSSWGAFFAATNLRTPDHGWKLVAPQTHFVSSTLMTACPAIRFYDGYYYVAATSTGMCPRAGWENTTNALCVVVFRYRTLRGGEWVLGNGGRPIVFPGDDDRRIAPQWTPTKAERAAILGHAPQDRGDINDSDFDFCDTAHGDVLGIFAGIANQASNPYFNIAASVQNMTSAQWLASYF
eukprot:SAG25_NODE_282_length_10426_cov_27.226784_2_plen_671_part_00